MITLDLANAADLRWAQQQVAAHHYLHTPVDARCAVLAYVLRHDGTRVGALLFGRPEATRCYTGALTYGSQADVASGKAQYDRWEIINLARVWIAPALQQRGAGWLGSWSIAQALRRVVVDYLTAYPPCFPDEPWRLRAGLSYCDTRVHRGTLYRAAGFQLARTNQHGIQTWYRPLRGLQGNERIQIARLSQQHPRSRRYRAQRAATYQQEVLL